MARSLKHPDAWLKLLLGGAIAAWLLFGAALVMLGLFDLLWLIRVSGYGLLLICAVLYSRMYHPPAPTRKQVKWSLVRIGVAYILGLALAALYWYYCT